MREKRDTDNSDDRRKKRTERKTRRDRQLQKERKILLKIRLHRSDERGKSL
jgi:hypothetical protein